MDAAFKLVNNQKQKQKQTTTEKSRKVTSESWAKLMARKLTRQNPRLDQAAASKIESIIRPTSSYCTSLLESADLLRSGKTNSISRHRWSKLYRHQILTEVLKATSTILAWQLESQAWQLECSPPAPSLSHCADACSHPSLNSMAVPTALSLKVSRTFQMTSKRLSRVSRVESPAHHGFELSAAAGWFAAPQAHSRFRGMPWHWKHTRWEVRGYTSDDDMLDALYRQNESRGECTLTLKILQAWNTNEKETGLHTVPLNNLWHKNSGILTFYQRNANRQPKHYTPRE